MEVRVTLSPCNVGLTHLNSFCSVSLGYSPQVKVYQPIYIVRTTSSGNRGDLLVVDIQVSDFPLAVE